MVSGPCMIGLWNMLLVSAQQSTAPVLERLDPPRRAAVVMALLALTLIGLFLITFAMVGGHWVRRLARHRPGRRVSTQELERERQLRDALQTFLPDIKSGDTVLLDTSSMDTKVET